MLAVSSNIYNYRTFTFVYLADMLVREEGHTVSLEKLVLRAFVRESGGDIMA